MKTINRKELAKLCFIKLKRNAENEAALEIASQLLTNPTYLIIGCNLMSADIERAMDYLLGCKFAKYCNLSPNGTTYSFDLGGNDIEISDSQHSKIINEILYNK